MRIALPEGMEKYVEQRITEDGFRDASEYVSALIRDEQERRAEEKLHAMLTEGIESGEPEPVTEEFWEGLRQELAVRKRLKAG